MFHRITPVFIATALLLLIADGGVLALLDPPTCLPTATQGCLNGMNYSWATQMPCGGEIMTAATQGCCGYGFIFDPSQDFCCVGSAWGYNKKQCILGGVKAPLRSAAQIGDRSTTAKERSARASERLRQVGDPCTGISPDGMGCVNGVPYNMSTQSPCGNVILNLTAGEKCCPNGIRWHEHNETCCFEPSHKPNTYVVVPQPNACSAQ